MEIVCDPCSCSKSVPKTSVINVYNRVFTLKYWPFNARSIFVNNCSLFPIGGSFRHFLWQVVRELQSSVLPILLPCPSGATGVNHGRYILATGPMTFSEEKLLQFFGQVSEINYTARVLCTFGIFSHIWKVLYMGDTMYITTCVYSLISIVMVSVDFPASGCGHSC